MSDTQIKIVCPDHGVELEGFKPAPGIGWVAFCPIDQYEWSVLGGVAHDPAEVEPFESLDNFR